MTKKEIVRDICERAKAEKLMKGNLTQLATKEIVQWTFEAIIETLVKEGRIELRNFGVFEVKQRKPRKARNPRTGERVNVAAKLVVTFQPGKQLEEKVRTSKAVEQEKRRAKATKGKSKNTMAPPPGNHREVEVHISLLTVDPSDDLLLIDRIQSLIADVMDLHGFELSPEHEPTVVTGSWFGDFKFLPKEPATQAELVNLLKQLCSSLQNANGQPCVLAQDDANPTVSELLESISEVDEGVIRLGKVLIVKAMAGGSSRLLVEWITPELDRELKKKSNLARNPRELLAYFDGQAIEESNSESEAERRLGMNRDGLLYDAFLSYRRLTPDKEFALDLTQQLELRGYTVVYDTRDFRVSAHFLNEMERCIKESRFTLVILSSKYLNSGNCIEESVICKTLDMTNRTQRIIPIKIETIQVPTWLFGIVGIDTTPEEDMDETLEKLTKTLGDPIKARISL